jgi:hypothetical protein
LVNPLSLAILQKADLDFLYYSFWIVFFSGIFGKIALVIAHLTMKDWPIKNGGQFLQIY